MGIKHPTNFKWMRPPKVTWDAVQGANQYIIYTGADPNNMQFAGFVPASAPREIDVPEGHVFALGYAFDNIPPYDTQSQPITIAEPIRQM